MCASPSSSSWSGTVLLGGSVRTAPGAARTISLAFDPGQPAFGDGQDIRGPAIRTTGAERGRRFQHRKPCDARLAVARTSPRGRRPRRGLELLDVDAGIDLESHVGTDVGQ